MRDFQEHLEVGLVQKVFWCVRGGMANEGLGAEMGGYSEMPKWAWPGHEIYFTAIILILPGGLMTAAYGAIAFKICQCMKERNYLTGGEGTGADPGGGGGGGSEGPCGATKGSESQPENK